MKKLFSLIFLFTIVALVINPGATIAQNVSVSAVIPPRMSDYQFAFDSDGYSTLPNNATVSYQITYGSTLNAFDTPNTIITADWSEATAPNGAAVVDYYMGTATDAYGGVKPVIDLQRHTITWMIPNLPAKIKAQTVSFKLLTTNNYTGSSPVNFTVEAKMSNPYYTFPNQVVQKSYQYYQTPAPTSILSPTPMPITSLSPTPSPKSANSTLHITNLSLVGTSQKETSFSITTTAPTKLLVKYGTSPTNLTKIVATQSFSRLANISFTNLLPNTTYYLQITATSPDEKSITSEIFTFKTALHSIPPNLDNSIIVLSSSGNVLSSDVQKQIANKSPFIVLTINSDYQIAYTLTNPVKLHAIDAVIQNNVLAASSTEPIHEHSEIIIPMEQKSPTQYVADLQSLTSGTYTVAVRVTDTSGNIIEKKIADLKILPHLTVYAQDTNQPLQDARIFLSYFDTQTHSFQPITPELFGNIVNPSYTNSYGQIKTILPPGNYRIEESALLYDGVIKDFSIGPGSDQNFPIIYLKRDPANLYSLAVFAKDYLGDSWSRAFEILNYAASSIRIFHLISVLILGSFVLLTFLLFLLRSHLTFRHLPVYLLFHLHWLVKQHKQNYLYGTVSDEYNVPQSRVRIDVEDEDTKNIIAHTYTNKPGKFYLRNTFENNVTLLVSCVGFKPEHVFVDKASVIPDGGLSIMLKKGNLHHLSAAHLFLVGLGDVMGMLFEVSLVISIILELLFFSLYGLEKVALYFILSLFNVIIWLFYLREYISK